MTVSQPNLSDGEVAPRRARVSDAVTRNQGGCDGYLMISSSMQDITRRGARRLAPVPAVALLAAALAGALAATGLLPFGRPLRALLLGSLPFDVVPTTIVAAAIGLGTLVVLAVGLLRRKRLSWQLAIVLYVAAAIAQGLFLDHRVGGLLALACVGVLVGLRRFYTVAGPERHPARIVALAILAGLGSALNVMLALQHELAVVGSFGELATATDTLATSFAFAGVRPLAWLAGGPDLLGLALLAVRLPIFLIALAALLPADAEQLPSSVAERAESTLRNRGHGALLPFQLGRDKRRFVAPDGGVLVSGTQGRFEVALGDPVGVDDPEPSIASFIEACRARDQIPAFYQASTESLPALAAVGMRTFRVGHEAILPIEGFTLQTPRRANLRHTISRARRGGVTFEFHRGLDADDRARLLPGLLEIDAAWQATAGPRLGFTIGRFDIAEIGDLAVAVAIEADGRPSAFTTFRPTGQGSWVLDLMRRSAGGTPGGVEGCLVEAVTALAEDGATSLSLGLAPLAGIVPDARGLEERGLVLAARLARRSYDVEGLAFFKSKFDPTWIPRYGAVPGRLDLVGLAIALLGLHLGGYRRAALQLLRDAATSATRRRARSGEPVAAGTVQP
jgi:phosphatidylglycerol lysyltransferase